MAHITYSISDEQTDVVFSASSTAGEDWMETPEVRVPVGQAQEYRQAAQEAG